MSVARAAAALGTSATRQTTSRVVLAACLVAPWLFAGLVAMSRQTPNDTLLGRWVHESASAPPLVVLSFASQWVLPVLGAVAGGVMVGGAYHHRLWDGLLTRGSGRSAMLAATALTAAATALVDVVVLGGSSILAGLPVGDRTLVALDGSVLGPDDATGRVVAAWVTVLLPVLTWTGVAVLLSVVTRSMVGGIAGTTVLALVSQIPALVDLPLPVRRLLPGTAFESWHGVVAAAPDWTPVLRGGVVSLAYLTVAVVLASTLFLRQDLR